MANLGHTLVCKKTVLVTILLDIYQSGLFQQCRGVSKIHFTQGVVESTIFLLVSTFFNEFMISIAMCESIFNPIGEKIESLHCQIDNLIYQIN